MSSSLSKLYSQYEIFSQTYKQAIQEYNVENQQNIQLNVILHLNSGTSKTFYVGKYDLSKYYDLSDAIVTIDIYDGLIISLYETTDCSGSSTDYMSTTTDSYTTQTIDSSIYKSLSVERLDKRYDSYPGKIFQTFTAPQINDTLTSTECSDLCANSNCSASVFNTLLNTCSIYKTPGTLQKGTEDDTTMIPYNRRKLLIITELNNNLKNIVQDITIETNTVLKENELSLGQKQISLDEYNKNKKKLENLQSQLLEQQEEYNSLETELTNSSSIIMRNVNMYYVMWIFLIFLIVMILKNIFAPNVSNPDNLFWIILIICIILASYNINNPYGYLLWCILILIFILKIILPRI